ncbi:MAG TPA: T9SS type A sorting domain-containing protein [Flavobacteriales bacterium]|nr:T9SS type A sorting domain-containing protein [Flavobacteriales bacterium]
MDEPDPTFDDATLLLCPDPVSTTLTIRTAIPGILTIVDTTGRTALHKNFTGGIEVIDVTPMNGLYTVLLDVGQTRLSGRVIIQ